MRAYQVAGVTKFWGSKSSADRVATKLHNSDDAACWVAAWEFGKGWFLEDLNEVTA